MKPTSCSSTAHSPNRAAVSADAAAITRPRAIRRTVFVPGADRRGARLTARCPRVAEQPTWRFVRWVEEGETIVAGRVGRV